MSGDTGDALVWVVTDGCYSDYHIVAVFDNESAARAYAAQLGGEDVQVEPYSLNNSTPTPAVYWEVTVCSDPNDTRFGAGRPYRRETNDWVTTREQNKPTAWYWAADQRLESIGAFHGEAIHQNPLVATKIARDAMYQYMAEHPELVGA